MIQLPGGAGGARPRCCAAAPGESGRGAERADARTPAAWAAVVPRGVVAWWSGGDGRSPRWSYRAPLAWAAHPVPHGSSAR